ncbi:MAG: hypothetical protein RR293_08580 [Bacteroidales bacterium]
MKLIFLQPKFKKDLVAKYGCSADAVNKALRFSSYSDNAKKIRQDALEKYHGKLITQPDKY